MQAARSCGQLCGASWAYQLCDMAVDEMSGHIVKLYFEPATQAGLALGADCDELDINVIVIRESL